MVHAKFDTATQLSELIKSEVTDGQKRWPSSSLSFITTRVFPKKQKCTHTHYAQYQCPLQYLIK